MDIDSLIDRFIFSLQTKGFSENTISSYAADLKEFSKFFSKRDLTKDNLMEFIENVLVNRYKPSTVNRKLSSIRGFLKFLLKYGHTDIDYSDLKNIKTKRVPPDYIPFEVIKKAIGEDRDGLIVRLMYASGLRISEIVNLKISDIMFESGFVKVKGKGNKERFVPVDLKTINAIRHYIESFRKQIKGYANSDYLFISNRGKPFSRQGLWKIIKKRFNRLGYNIHPHMLRHMFATHMIENGANIRAVQEMLGHENITTTQIYTDISDNAVEDAFRKADILK
ncbi:site-specific tyrosine recombinase/integron integrase [Hippea alviniae]|uniref:site-specific tyrosine recombinase/integron integrase n=1 Tax=Hippea alviniae TaxID=1279027 RepID=UPI0003B3BEA1|nr:site-specific tyrosine recombinase/integron integrase [Hippea alviniae]